MREDRGELNTLETGTLETISVLSAGETDIARIYEIEREAISPPWSREALLSEINREDSFFSVARGELVTCNPEAAAQGESARDLAVQGFVILRRMGDEGELLQIAVCKTARRCGIADILLDAALSHAEKCELKSVFLEVRKSNEAAISLYKKHGFKTVRLRKDYYNNPLEDAVVMVCRWYGCL